MGVPPEMVRGRPHLPSQSDHQQHDPHHRTLPPAHHVGARGHRRKPRRRQRALPVCEHRHEAE